MFDEHDAPQEHKSDCIAELVEYLVLNLVDEPDAVAIDITDTSETTCLIEVRVAEDDVGKPLAQRAYRQCYPYRGSCMQLSAI